MDDWTEETGRRLVLAYEKAVAELDRLRAVVDAARELRRLADDATEWRGYGLVNRVHDALFVAVDALDAGPDVGDELRTSTEER